MYQVLKTKNCRKSAALLLVAMLFFATIPAPERISSKLGSLLARRNIVDRIYLARSNSNVVDSFRLSAPAAEAATDPDRAQYALDIGPISGSTSVGYSYATFFNPTGSAKTAVIKRIAVKANAVAAGTYANLTVRRISAASAGTQIAPEDILKKNGNSVSSSMEVRHTGPSVTYAGTTDSRIISQIMPGTAGTFHSYRDISFGQGNEEIVVQPGEGLSLYQESAGTANHRIRFYVEWEEKESSPTPQGGFLFAFPRVEAAAVANYAYNSFYNPSGSGKSAIVRKVWFGAETCDTTAIYTNNITLRRTISASGGSQVSSANVPKKNTSSSASSMDFRYAGPSVGLSGGSDSRIAMVTPCAAAGQPHGWMKVDFSAADEQLVLQQGEGIAVISEATGDVDQIVRMVVEWDEVSAASTPAPRNEYFFNYLRVSNEAVAPAANTTFYTFFNPASSGKTAVVKRLGIRNNADAAATYASFGWRRISAASGGALVASADIPKKNTSSVSSAMELRSCGAACASAITATYSGTADSRLLSVNGPGAVGQVIGQREVVFGENEKLVLQPGEGVGFYLDVSAGDIDHYVKAYIEWDEENSPPAAQNGYLADIGPVNGSTTANYVYASFFNPAASGKTAVVKKISLRIDAQSTALYIPMSLRRTTASSGGVQILSANIPKKNSSSAASSMDIRRTGPAVTFVGTTDSRLASVQTPGTVGAAAAPATTGYREISFEDEEDMILQPGEGLALYQEAAGDADFRVKILVEWEEVSVASTPASQGEYQISSGPINGSLSSGFVYSSFFNPMGSGKNYVIKRIEIRSNRVAALTAPGYVPITAALVSSSNGGTQVAVANFPKKHSSAGASTAELRYGGPAVTISKGASARILGVTAPGGVNQYGDYENVYASGQEMVLRQGEGVALFQEGVAGDLNMRMRLSITWSEMDAPVTGSLGVDIVDSGGNPVASPSFSFTSGIFDWSSQQSSGTLGSPSQKIRLTNSTTNPSWALSMAASAGPAALWTSGGNTYDFNGTSITGRLRLDPSLATISPQSGCTVSGISKGSAAYFVQGVQDSINLVTASSSADAGCYWDITGISAVQDIPASQSTGSYVLNVTLTAS